MNDPSLVSPPAAARDLRAWALTWMRQRRAPLLFIGVPTLLASLYYFLIAADLYASEARFVVRSPSHVPCARHYRHMSCSARGSPAPTGPTTG